MFGLFIVNLTGSRNTHYTLKGHHIYGDVCALNRHQSDRFSPMQPNYEVVWLLSTHTAHTCRCSSTCRLSAEMNNTWRKMTGGASGPANHWLAQLRIWLTDAERRLCMRVCLCVCVFMCISQGIPPSPALSGSSTAPLEECCSQEGRATSTPLIFYQQGGFIGLINSLFACVVCMRKEERGSCGV